jgi:O-antigen/teichoic acid export membrane protein
MLVGIVSTVIFPAFSRIQDNKNAIGKTYLDAIKYLSILGVPVTVGVIFIAPEFVEIFLTEKWIGIVPIIQLLSLFFLANVIGGGLWGATLYSLGYSYKVLKLTLIRLIALTFFVSMGIYLGGLMGVIIGMVIYGFIFRFAYQHIINKWIKITMIDYLKVLIPSFCCAISMTFTLIIYKLYLSTMMINIVNLILMMIIGTISYSIILKTLFPKEFKLIFDFFREPLSSINIKYKNG